MVKPQLTLTNQQSAVKLQLITIKMANKCESLSVPAEENGELQTLICVLVARPRLCSTLSNPVL